MCLARIDNGVTHSLFILKCYIVEGMACISHSTVSQMGNGADSICYGMMEEVPITSADIMTKTDQIMCWLLHGAQVFLRIN